MSQFAEQTLVVAGAGGNLGRRTVEYLIDRGATNVVAVTRKPEQVADLAARGVEVRRGDFDDVASLDEAFRGTDRVLVISTDNLMVPGGRAAQHIRAIDAAERAGASHILYTSLINPHPHPTALVARDHFFTENRIAHLDTDWSILRNNVYAEMLLDAVPRALGTGVLAHAAGTGATAHVTRDDCAAAAAGALLTATGKAVYDISGPAAVTKAEIAALLSRLTGKTVVDQNLPADTLLGGMVAAGLPPAMAAAFLHFDTDAAKGYFAVTSDAVKILTGRDATAVADFLAQHQVALAA